MRNIFIKAIVGAIIIILILFIYTIWDNNRIVVVEQNIVIDSLPKELEGFTILQISDLHEKEFGSNQRKLIDKINSIDYDAIVFTGDMLNGVGSNNYDSFYTLIEGIKNKEHALYVPGNTDPESYLVDDRVVKSKFVKGLEERGVKLLESIYTINEDLGAIHIVDFEISIKKDKHSSTNGIVRSSYAMDPVYLEFQDTLLEEMTILGGMDDSDILIALNHYPVVDKRIDFIQNRTDYIHRNYDLIIAGHYHGGQIRLPFIGAIFVPEPWYASPLFPPRNRVKGLWEYKGIKQYVSAGLGSSDAVSFFDFRFLNTPEINVLRLVGR